MDVNERGMRFTPKESKDNTSCCVLGCKSYAKDSTLSFHTVPKIGASKVEIINKSNVKELVDRGSLWIRLLKINPNFKKATVCSLHFTQDDYKVSYLPRDRNILINNAVPSVNLPTDTPSSLEKKEINNNRDKRTEKRGSKREFCLINEASQRLKKKRHAADSKEYNSVAHQLVESEQVETASLDGQQNENSFEFHNRCQDKSVQTEIVDQNFINSVADKCVQVDCEKYREFIRNEKDLITMTGLCSFKMLILLENIAMKVVPNLERNFCKNSCTMSVKDRIVLTFVKLKQNTEYTVLSVLFKIFCEETCRKIFLRMINILAVGLKFAIRWPSKQEILMNIPKCFEDFLNVRAVIDGIEIFIQKPKKVCCQSEAFSSYKSTYTVKFITAVSPAGLITFISEAYPGRSSDKAIFEQSTLINKFEKDDGLMTDKGFLIDDVCLKNSIKLIRPPFLRSKKQFTKEEALAGAKIAKARVHIERSNQRLKVFKILSTRVPTYLVGRIDQIFLIISAIVNLSAPILKDDKFIIL